MMHKSSVLETVSSADYKAGMKRLIGGVCLVTTEHDGVPQGCTATAVTSVTADPPTLLVCLNGNSKTHAGVVASGVFGVSVLMAHNTLTARRFAGMDEAPAGDRFACEAWTTHTTGVLLLRDAAAVFDCRVTGSVAVGTHTVFFGEVTSVDTNAGASLGYQDGAFLSLKA